MYNDGLGLTAEKQASTYKGITGYARMDDEVQTIEGKNLEDCKQKLYREFGHNYTIVGQRPQFKGGFLGFGQKEFLEVRYTIGAKKPAAAQETFQKNRDEILAKAGSTVTNTIQIASIDKKIDDFQKKIEMKLSEIASATQAGDKPVSIQKIEELLQENEFTFSYINKISNRLRTELSVDELDDFDFVQKKVVDWIGQSISLAPKLPHTFPHVVIVVGPTGVGKTTTIAKFAVNLIKEAHEKNERRPRVRMLTTDHTRVGAVEQIKRYGDVMEIEVDKAETAADVKKILDTYKDNLDVLFIDTPGYSPRDFENLGKMRKMLEVQGLHPDVYLACTASSKARDLISIIQNYEVFNFSSVIITKWDETSAIGNVISVLSEKGKAVSYITDGQTVTKNIERASIVRFLTNLHDFSIDRNHIDETFPEDK
ncbi:MAG: flagellar biosynthesis protein FlhF [Treponema sp.]|nr:flagellar biosynthesis protein FlhF [Treponema sp.]